MLFRSYQPSIVALDGRRGEFFAGELVAALGDARDPSAVLYRRDEDMHAARPDTAHLPARWWRHVVARACEEIPGVVIVSDRD